MAVAELIELMQNESASIDMQFQLWITVTSAVVIACHAARNHLTLWLKTFVVSMYVLATAAITLRYANDASQFQFLSAELQTRGVAYPSVGDLRLLRTLVYIIGTAATLLFVFKNPGARRIHERCEDPKRRAT